MKKIVIAAVGRIKEQYLRDAVDEYRKRLSRFCDLEIIEIEDCGDEKCVEKESAALLNKLNGIDFLLDIGGEAVTSKQLSNYIEAKYTGGKDKITFVIGGSRGVDLKVKNLSEKSISFGRVTYPHQLMRVLVLEQIYRAFTISNNMPYHK